MRSHRSSGTRSSDTRATLPLPSPAANPLQRTHSETISKTQLHRAANGCRVPWPVVEKFARGCGVDPRTVQELWQEATSRPEDIPFGLDDVEGITSFEQLREAMAKLLRARRLSQRELSQREPFGRLPRSTLNDALLGKTRLRKDLVLGFVRALQLGVEQEDAWSAAWERASLTKSVRHQVIDFMPSPHLLQVLSDIDMPEWNCLAELVDSALGRQGTVSGSAAAARSPLEVSIDFRRDAEGHDSEIVVRDQGAGMDGSQMLDSVRLSWAGNRLSVAGFGINIAMFRLGSVVTMRTARREAAAWSVLSLDLRSLTHNPSWEVPLRLEPKERKDEHGTEITISGLRSRRPRRMPGLRDRLGDIYSYLIRENRLRLALDGRLVPPRMPCVWDAARTVERREGPVSARQTIDVTLATVQQCRACGASVPLDADACLECGSRHLMPLPHRVWGWLGIQRYLHPTDYGIDFYRHGRKILVRDKSLFMWSDEDTGSALSEYPADLPHQGRIVGEIHCDHVPVTWSKDAFATDSSAWRGVVRVIRGQGPLGTHHSQQLAYPKNTSPLAVLFRAFRRNDPGLRCLVPGDGRRSMHKRAQEWGKLFHRGHPDFRNDQSWNEAAAAHDAQRLRPAGNDRAFVAPGSLAQLKHHPMLPGRHTPMGSSRTEPAPQAVVRCTYLFDREARTNRDGSVNYRATGQRLRVSNIGSGTADRLRIRIEPVGDGTGPLVMHARDDGTELTVDRLVSRTHVDFPIARTWGTAPEARLIMNWDEGGQEFEEIQSIRWG